MNQTTQSYANHRRYVPAYGALFAILSINVIYSVVYSFRHPAFDSYWRVALGIGFLIFFFTVRGFATHNQDRIIRLEERLRLAQILPDGLKARISELSEAQLVGLRFASDAEVPALMQKTLTDRLDREAIKKVIQNWRADTFRV